MEAFGKYRLVAPLANGGMAQVHLVEQVGLQGFSKVVVLKRMYPHTAGDRALRDMFLGEARVAARLDHPNIATVYELGEHEGTYFIVMEYLPGEDLGSVLRACRRSASNMPVPIALNIVQSCALGLHYAHELVGPDGRPTGLVHRDVNPTNVMVTFHGQVKVLDFGIAKIQAGAHPTQAGTFKGKLSHASPEQISGSPVDRRTDVFQLGILLWELLACERLFAGTSEAMIVDRIRHAPIQAPSTLRRDIPPTLDAVVARALARPPSERFPTARDMAEALAACQRELGASVGTVDVGKWIGNLVGPEIVGLKLAIAQGRELEKATSRLAQITQSRSMSSVPARASSSTSGGKSRSRARAAWSHDLAGGTSAPAAPRSSDGWLRSASDVRSGLPVPAVSDRAATPLPARTASHHSAHGSGHAPPPAPPASIPPPRREAEVHFSTVSSGGSGPHEMRSTSTGVLPGHRRTLIIGAAVAVAAIAGVTMLVGRADDTSPIAPVASVRSVSVNSVPAGALVLIDGEPSGRLTPTTLTNLPTDRAVNIRLELRGHGPKTHTIPAGGGPPAPIEVTLTRSIAVVNFDGLPTGARLFVDGREIANPRSVELAIGSHAVRVESDTELLERRTVEVTHDVQTVSLGGSR